MRKLQQAEKAPQIPFSAWAMKANPVSSEEKSKLLLYKGAHSTGKLILEQGQFDFKVIIINLI